VQGASSIEGLTLAAAAAVASAPAGTVVCHGQQHVPQHARVQRQHGSGHPDALAIGAPAGQGRAAGPSLVARALGIAGTHGRQAAAAAGSSAGASQAAGAAAAGPSSSSARFPGPWAEARLLVQVPAPAGQRQQAGTSTMPCVLARRLLMLRQAPLLLLLRRPPHPPTPPEQRLPGSSRLEPPAELHAAQLQRRPRRVRGQQGRRPERLGEQEHVRLGAALGLVVAA
jgi:hypothetical protein